MPALASEPDVLTACLACGWVHGFPWRCPTGQRSAVVPTFRRQNANAVRVGKANTLLLTPNDWSTLSNGAGDGEPTGLHRYVGENPTSGDGRSTDCRQQFEPVPGRRSRGSAERSSVMDQWSEGPSECVPLPHSDLQPARKGI